MRTEWIEVRGASVAAHCVGDRGPAIIFCHGNSQSSRAFERQLEGTLAAQFRLIAIDLPGHGESARAAEPAATYCLPGYADVVVEVARTLGVSDGVFVGWSLGGHVVLEAIGRLADAAGFFIFGTPPLAFPPAMDRAFLPNPAMAVPFRAESTDEEIRGMIAALVKPGTAVPESFYQDFVRTDPRARALVGESLGPGGYLDEVEIVATLAKPIAIAHGEHEQVVNRRYFDELRAPTLWRGAVQDLPGVGHAAQWEDSAAFDSLLEAFVRDCTAR